MAEAEVSPDPAAEPRPNRADPAGARAGGGADARQDADSNTSGGRADATSAAAAPPAASGGATAPTTGGAADPYDERVLLLAPTGRDAQVLAEQLRRRGLDVEVCAGLGALCDGIAAGAGAAFVAEEALRGGGRDCLAQTLRRQPPWSDLPLIVMTESGQTSTFSQRLGDLFGSGGNVTLLQRPVRLVTLYSVIDSALKSRRRQYQVRELLEESRRAVEQRDRFLAMLGHELRNPLAAVVNAAAILRKFGLADPELSAEQFDVIGRQSSHMARLVDDLLDVARITAGKVVLNLKPVDLREVAARALQALRLASGQQRHEITYDVPARPVVVNADVVRLEQVLMNLLTNAVKYTPDGGRVWLAVAADGTNGGAEATISVRDTGEGIPPDMLHRIFEPFTQLTASLARSRGGLGMGLTVVRSLVEMHGGSVTARSEGPGTGTEFLIRLPLARPAGEAAAPPRQAAGPSASRPCCNVLVVEDNPDSRRTMARLLQLLGHKVETAEDGPAGLAAALTGRPQVVLLDIGLPGMDGYEVGRQIRRGLGDAVYLIALTGYGQPEDRDRVLQAGFDLHLVKPVDADHLDGVLTNVPRHESRRDGRGGQTS